MNNSPFSATQLKAAQKLLRICAEKRLMLACAESCTGGLLSALLTELPGSSAVFDRGFITYSYAAKTKQLGVKPATLQRHGAVSSAVALAMVQGCLKQSEADIAIAITGIAGPGGGTPHKPVGLVYIATQKRGKKALVTKNLFKGSPGQIRAQIRAKTLRQAVGQALQLATESV